MADGRSGRLLGRLALRAGQLLLSGVLLIVTAPLWLACTLVLMVLLMARPFIVAILGAAVLGGLGASAFFAYPSAWSDAAQAAVIVVITGGLWTAYLAFADRFNPPDIRDSFLFPPWWW